MIFTLFVLAWLLIGVFSMIVGGKIHATIENKEEEFYVKDVCFWTFFGPISFIIITCFIIHTLSAKNNHLIFTLKPFKINKKESK